MTLTVVLTALALLTVTADGPCHLHILFRMRSEVLALETLTERRAHLPSLEALTVFLETVGSAAIAHPNGFGLLARSLHGLFLHRHLMHNHLSRVFGVPLPLHTLLLLLRLQLIKVTDVRFSVMFYFHGHGGCVQQRVHLFLLRQQRSEYLGLLFGGGDHQHHPGTV